MRDNSESSLNKGHIAHLWERWKDITALSQNPFIGELPATVFRDEQERPDH
ncbi:MAG: hypothetical protein ACP5HZ_08495 [Ferrimicrobium sp.]|uniref:hypothetical protein n=1 Tax=Ferrimicrobium sp. TaxID=2926050 RepID=UPI002633089C|nr:hypothetical protein [Ferrimicrobium sp.]